MTIRRRWNRVRPLLEMLNSMCFSNAMRNHGLIITYWSATGLFDALHGRSHALRFGRVPYLGLERHNGDG